MISNFKKLQIANELFDKNIKKSIKCFKNILKIENLDENIVNECKEKLYYIKIYNTITKGDIKTLQSFKFNNKILYNNKNNLLHHCIDCGDLKMFKILLKLGGHVNMINNSNTLLEYACMKKDPNIVNFLLNNGANLEKHIFLRKNTKNMIINFDDIDILIILKIILFNNLKCKIDNIKFLKNNFNFLKNYFTNEIKIGINNFKLDALIIGLNYLFYQKKSYNTYKNILIEELNYNFNSNFFCPVRKLDIVLINIIPFINYPFNLTSEFVIFNDLKFTIKKYYNHDNFKNILYSYLVDYYVKKNITTLDHLGLIVYKILNKNI